jgi:arabinofuranosyltransferase
MNIEPSGAGRLTHASKQRLLEALSVAPGVVLAICYVFVSRRATGSLGFPLDDAWIHAQFARNLATWHGFTYTGPAWVSGSTAPAWTVLLAIAYALTRNMVVSAIALGLALQALTGVFVRRIAETAAVPRGVSWIAGTLATVMPVMVWGAVSGMEVPLVTALVAAGVFYYLAGRQANDLRRYIGFGLLGLAALARPETLAMSALVAAGELFDRGSRAERLRHFAAAVAIVAFTFAPLVIFSYATIGRPLPTTFYAKSGPGLLRAAETRDRDMLRRDVTVFAPRAVANYALILTDQLSWAAYLLVLGVAGFRAAEARRLAALGFVIFLAVPFAMGLIAPQRLKPDNVRYAAQLLVLAPPLMVAGVWHAFRRSSAVAIVGAIACVLTAGKAFAGAPAFALSVKNIQELHIKTARWLIGNTPPHAVIAANDVGALAYFSGRRILDLEGLVSPEVLPYRQLPQRGLREVIDLRPAYIVIFPEWYPEIASSPLFYEIRRIGITDNQISAGDTLIVYRTPWAP